MTYPNRKAVAEASRPRSFVVVPRASIGENRYTCMCRATTLSFPTMTISLSVGMRFKCHKYDSDGVDLRL